MNDIHEQVAKVLREHPAVLDAAVFTDSDGRGEYARIVADPATAGALHRSAALEAAGRLGGLGWHEPAGALRVAGLNRGETDFLYRELFTDNAYFRHGIALPAGAVVVDVGANIGLFTLRVAAHSPGARIVAVEPVDELADAVALNAELYGADVTVLRTALGSAEGETAFTFYAHNSVMSGRFADPVEDLDVLRGYLLTGEDAREGAQLDRMAADRMAAEPRRVPVTTLTAVVRELGLDRVDLLKIDVEKAEAEVLDGIDDSVWPRVDRIVMEVHDVAGRLADVLARLRDRGFDTTTDQDPRLTRTPCHNVYARRPRSATGTAPVVLPAVLPAGLPDGLPDGGPTLRRLAAELRELTARRLPTVPAPGRFTLVAGLDDPPDRAAAVRREITLSPRVAVLARIWTQFFGADAVRADADFFDLGGDSLAAVRLLAILEDELGEDALTPDLIFTDSTFGALAEAVGAGGAGEDTERTARP